jgi:hypothetical protein
MTDHELRANAERFRSSLVTKFADNVNNVVEKNADKIDGAYARMTTLQAWRSFVLDESSSSSSLGFFSEAQNDGLTSIVLVSGGLWRPSLKSLRSLLENILHCLYYRDHPVEYRLWEEGKYRPTFKSLFDYFDDHPDVNSVPDALRSISALRRHYRELSEVVHASAKKSRMTDDLNQTQIWKSTQADIGRWSTLHKNVIKDINLLLLALLKEHIQAASKKGLRESLALVIPEDKDEPIFGSMGVRIVRP